jgi:hypothetical protein
MPLRTLLLDHEGRSCLRNRRQKGKRFRHNGSGPLPTDRGPDSAGARADCPLRLQSLTLCSDSYFALCLPGPGWASFSTVKHGHLQLPTRSCSG